MRARLLAPKAFSIMFYLRRTARDGKAYVEPVNPLERGVFDLVDVAPRAAFPDYLGFVQPVDRFSQCVV